MKNTNVADWKALNTFLKKNKSVDFRNADLFNKSSIDQYKWTGSDEKKDNLIAHLKAYQRLLRLLPIASEKLAKSLFEKGIHSSLQIASTPKKAFVTDNLKLFGNDAELATLVYHRAIALRKAITLQYINRTQQLESHARAAGVTR